MTAQVRSVATAPLGAGPRSAECPECAPQVRLDGDAEHRPRPAGFLSVLAPQCAW